MKIAKGISLISDFLSLEECQNFINYSENGGYEEATISFPGKPKMMKGARNNDRFTFESQDLALSLFDRIESYINKLYPDKPPHSLNAKFRFYRYIPGQRFKRHIDGSAKLAGLESRLTFLMYLNENCEGGETIFRPKGAEIGSAEEHKIEPKTGAALLFEHHLWHEGAPVIKGLKYVLRTDVFYTTED